METAPELVRPQVTPPPPLRELVPPARGMVVGGRFELLERLGVGGMGDVFSARHLGLDRVICLKIPRVSAPDEDERQRLVDRFRLEARAASRVAHPNVVRILDVGDDPAIGPYYAMELLTGTPLDALLRQEFPLGEERVCRIVAQVLEGLSAVHAAQVLHRDLKPSNVMLVAGGGGEETAKLLDFGIARVLDGPRLTRAGRVSGTPSYMSPEQATGGELDARADVYAIGVLLYEMLTGTLPFPGSSDTEILLRQVNEPPEPPRVRRPQVAISEEMERLVLWALQKDPAMRPSSAEELRRGLVRIAERAREQRETARRASDEHRRQEEAARLAARLGELQAAKAGSRRRLVGGLVAAAAALGVAFVLVAHAPEKAVAQAPIAPKAAPVVPVPAVTKQETPTAPAETVVATAPKATPAPAHETRPKPVRHVAAPTPAAAPAQPADDNYRLDDLKNPYD